MLLPPLQFAGATRIAARLVGSRVPHRISGYRDWVGQVEAAQPIVGLVLNIVGSHVSWARTSHGAKGVVKTRILFAPYDSDGCSIQVCFHMMDATAFDRTRVESVMVQPELPLVEFATGELVDIASVPGETACHLKAVLFAREDVKSARNGIWHLRGALAAGLSEPWHTILTYGRSGEFEAT